MQGSTFVKGIAAVAVLIFISVLALNVYRSGSAALNWEMGADDPVLAFYPSGDGLYVISAANISLVDSSGKAVWTIPFPGTEYSACDNGKLCVYSPDLGLNVIDADGTVKMLSKQRMNYDPIIGPNDAVYLRYYSFLYAIGPSGEEKWNMTSVVSDPAVDSEGNIYFFMRPPDHIADVYLTCVSPAGDVRWSTLYANYPASIRLMPARGSGVIVYDEPTAVLYCVDAGGSVAWEHSMGYLGQYSLMVDEKSRMYLFYLWGTVHILNEHGALIGKFNPVITNDANLSYAPAAYNDTVYVVGDSGTDSVTLHALGMDGSQKWERQLNSSEVPAIHSGGQIVCLDTKAQSGQPVLYVIDDAGRLKFTYYSGDGTRWEQVYIGTGDTVYARTEGGRLYALKG
jgi:PQQ-like domain